MDNQHRKILGYRELSADEIKRINRIKGMGKKLEEFINDVAYDCEGDSARWRAIAKTDFQTGVMALIRAIAKPDSF